MVFNERVIFIRAIIEAKNRAVAEPSITDLLSVLSVYGSASEESAEPYWKIADTFVILGLLLPNGDVLLIYEQLLGSLASMEEWHRMGTEDEPSAVWNGGNGATSRIERLRWVSVDVVSRSNTSAPTVGL